MTTIQIIVPYSAKVKAEIVPSPYVQDDRFFIMQDPNCDHILEHLRTIYSVEKDRADWIRRYDRTLKGLRFWQQKAMELGYPAQ